MRPTWGAGKQNATSLSLAPLSSADAAYLMSSLLGEVQVPEEVRERVLASAEGNPFYLEEMLNMLIEEGALERQNGGWVSTDVDILVDGRSIQREEYSNVRVNVPLDPSLWIPERWPDAPHPPS